MKAAVAVLSRIVSSPVFSLLRISTFAVAAGFLAGCGSGGSMSKPPGNTFSGNTSVMLLATSTANDKLQEFNLDFSSITLTSQSGSKATLLATPNEAEFMHLNGNVEPLATASVPQGIYTSATAIVSNAYFNIVQQFPSEKSDYLCEYGGVPVPSSQVKINLPASITITGNSMVLSLNLLVSKSVTYSGCGSPNAPYTSLISPTFNLIPITLAAQPTNTQNGRLEGLQGMISSVGPTEKSFKLALADSNTCVPATGQVCGRGAISTAANSRTWQIMVNDNTVFQGIANFSVLIPGMPVDMDTIIQPDGSLLATRIAVYNKNVGSLSVFDGPVFQMVSSLPIGEMFGQEQQGWLFGYGPIDNGPGPFGFANATFQISGQLNNLKDLPFSTGFSSSNMFAGQKASFSSNAVNFAGGPNYTPAATVTLLPQTIDGTVTAIGSDGGFTTYTVSLAPYDLFPNMAMQPGQTTVLTNPSSIVVYVDDNTQKLNTGSLAVGTVMRFNGLVFNDHGTLKMDCDWINDGVKE